MAYHTKLMQTLTRYSLVAVHYVGLMSTTLISSWLWCMDNLHMVSSNIHGKLSYAWPDQTSLKSKWVVSFGSMQSNRQQECFTKCQNMSAVLPCSSNSYTISCLFISVSSLDTLMPNIMLANQNLKCKFISLVALPYSVWKRKHYYFLESHYQNVFLPTSFKLDEGCLPITNFF